MNKKIAQYSAMAIYILSAMLLLARIINPIAGVIIFIASLIIFGLLSKGFKSNSFGNTHKKQ